MQTKVAIKSIEKGTQVLKLFSIDHPYITISEVSKALGWNRPTAFRICNTLAYVGLLERIERNHRIFYQLGLWLFELSRIAMSTVDIRKEAFQYLRHLAKETGHSSYLFLLVENRMCCIDRVHGVFIVQATANEVGDSLPLHKGGGPTAVLAFLPYKRQEDVLSEVSKEPGWSVALEKKWRLRLEKIRKQGYSVSKHETYKGTAAVGAPIFNANGEPIASVSVGGVAERFSNKSIPEIAKEIMQAAQAISKRMGFNLSEKKTAQ